MASITSAPPALICRCERLLLLLIFFSIRISNVAGVLRDPTGSENPFTPKASLLRYWKKQISNDLPRPEFLLEKASPLTAAQSAAFIKIAGDQNALSAKLPEFCKQAKLLCFPDMARIEEKRDKDVNFATYLDQNFTNYGAVYGAGGDSFQSYSENDNVVVDTFRRYSHDTAVNEDKFVSYGTQSNVVDQSFNSYSASAAGGKSQFTDYGNKTNVPNLRFTSYSDRGVTREQRFSTYTEEANAGDEGFQSYGKDGANAFNGFTSYAHESNVVGSNFKNYGEKGAAGTDNFTSYASNGNVQTNNFQNYGANSNGERDNFTSYGSNGNVPENSFRSYGSGGNAPTEIFANYRDQSNVGDDGFESYGKDSNAAKMDFVNYGQSFNEGTDKFSKYALDSGLAQIDFKIYGVNNTFKDYNENSTTTFSSYRNDTPPTTKKTNKWVEPGKFFRESMLKPGTRMPMPDIRDRMPKRSFLPRSIVSKLPFSTAKLPEIKKIFRAGEDDSSMSKMIIDALRECERASSPGETKRCVASIEDMIDFATSVLGRSVAARTTNSTAGSNGEIMIGSVKGINGGRVTKSVSCHQSLYPYLLYFCHSVPKVRVYEADILNPQTKAKINRGVAICHLDTTSWSSDHAAFVALGPGPGKIEVCHWIFENDLNWAVPD